MRQNVVAVIGAGLQGRRLAVLFHSAGYRTVLEDVLPSNLRKAAEHFEVLDKSESGSPVRFAGSVEDAVREADLIVDCVPDELESKLEIFSMMDRMAPPRAIFITPTRTLSIADLASCTYRADRCFAVELEQGASGEGGLPGAKKVTIVHTSQASAGALEAVRALWEAAGFEATAVLDPQEATFSSVSRP